MLASQEKKKAPDLIQVSLQQTAEYMVKRRPKQLSEEKERPVDTLWSCAF